MFETEVADAAVAAAGPAGWDAAATLAAAEANEHTLRRAEVRRLEIAAHWADLHPGDPLTADPGLPGSEHPVQPGGAGTPEVAEFCPAELGASLGLSAGSAARLIGDALDLRHRLPRCWAAVRAGQAPAWQARHLAQQTRHLTAAQAGQVDADLAAALGRIPYGRLQRLLDGAVYRADPAGADADAARAAAERFVRLGRSNRHGLRLVIARAAAGDATFFSATIDRIAAILGTLGDSDPVQVRRSKAVGILAQPAHALQLLSDHRGGRWDGPPEPDPVDEPFDELADEPGGERVVDDGPQLDPGLSSEGQTAGEQTPDVERAAEQPARAGQHQTLRIVPPPFDPDRVRPKAVLYVHLSQHALTAGQGVARLENHGPILLSRLRQILGDHTQLVLTPVIDLTDTPTPVDGYEIPPRMREHLLLRHPATTFPYAPGPSRRADLDHTLPYLPPTRGGPPGQTRISNLGPLSRSQHRIKTFSRWQVRQPEPDTWLWRSPHHRIYLINTAGTHPLGHSDYAQAIWHAAAPPGTPPNDTQLSDIDRSPPNTTATDHLDKPRPDESPAEAITRAHLDAFTLAS